MIRMCISHESLLTPGLNKTRAREIECANTETKHSILYALLIAIPLLHHYDIIYSTLAFYLVYWVCAYTKLTAIQLYLEIVKIKCISGCVRARDE